MEPKLKILPPEQLMPLLPRLLEDAAAIPLVISGNSMSPFLVHGRDTVFLSKLSAQPKRGDMLLYRRDNGAYVLHRVYRREGNACTMVGDAQQGLEPGIRDDQIIAMVTAVRRKGKLLKKGSFWWWFFEHFWLWALPCRPTLTQLYSFIKRK